MFARRLLCDISRLVRTSVSRRCIDLNWRSPVITDTCC